MPAGFVAAFNALISSMALETAASEAMGLVSLELSQSGHHRISNDAINRLLGNPLLDWQSICAAVAPGTVDQVQNLISHRLCTLWLREICCVRLWT